LTKANEYCIFIVDIIYNKSGDRDLSPNGENLALLPRLNIRILEGSIA